MAAIPCGSWGHSTKEAARRARIKRMMTEGKTIILSSPDELLPLIKRRRFASPCVNIRQIHLNCRIKGCLLRKMWKENSEFLNGPSPIGVRKALARLIQLSAGASFMNATCWKPTLPPGVSILRSHPNAKCLKPVSRR